MKTLLTLTLLLFSVTVSYAQMLTFTFEISEDLYQDMTRGNDKVEDLKQIAPYGYTNLSFKLTEAGSGKSSPWLDTYAEFYSPNPDGEKRTAKVKVDASLAFGNIDKTKDLQVYAKLKTAFKNRIWTKSEIPAGRYNEAIILDEYNMTADDMMGAFDSRDLILNPEQPWAADRHNFFTDELAANDDTLMKYQEGKFHVQMKNAGDEAWKVDVYPNDEPTSTYRAVEIHMRKYDFDYNKSFVIRLSVKTRNGNYLWREMTLEPNQLSAEIIADQHYSGAEFDASVPPRNAQEPEAEEVEEVTETEETETNQNESNQTETNETETETTEVENTSTETVATPVPTCVPGDTTLKVFEVYNDAICVKGAKYNLAGKTEGQLARDFDVMIQGTNFPLKGGSKVLLDGSKKHLIKAKVRESVSFEQDGASFIIKADSEVEFSKAGLTGANIEGSGEVTFNEIAFGCQPKEGSKGSDVQFDNKGSLKEFTSSNDADWNANASFTIPASSRIGIKNGALRSVTLKSATEITLFGKKFSVAPAKKASLLFKSNDVLESVVVGSGNSVEINGQTIPVQTNSEMELTFNGDYQVSTFRAGSAVTVTVEKKGKTKEVSVKAGKKIVIENGKIVKAG